MIECWECVFYSKNRYGPDRLSPPECTNEEREYRLPEYDEECEDGVSVSDAKYWSRIEHV